MTEREELRQLRLLKARVYDIDAIADEICEYFEGNQNYVWVPLAKAIHYRITRNIADHRERKKNGYKDTCSPKVTREF